MPFEPVQINLAKKSPLQQSVKWSARRMKSGIILTSVTIPLGIMLDLQWDEKTRLALGVGSGIDAGQLRFSPNATGTAELKFMKKSYRINLGTFPYGPAQPFALTSAPHTIDKNTLTLSCPILKATAPPVPKAPYVGMR